MVATVKMAEGTLPSQRTESPDLNCHSPTPDVCPVSLSNQLILPSKSSLNTKLPGSLFFFIIVLLEHVCLTLAFYRKGTYKY